MLLEKLNEVVWNVKRKQHSGRFEFRATEQSGDIKKVSISLIDDEKEQRSIAFEMNRIEFNRFYDIMTNFKGILESPHEISKAQLKTTITKPNPIPLEEDAIPLSLDGNSTTIDEEEAIRRSLDEMDIGLASLESLDDDEVGTSINSLQSPFSSKSSVSNTQNLSKVKAPEQKKAQNINDSNNVHKAKSKLIAPMVNSSVNESSAKRESSHENTEGDSKTEEKKGLDPKEWDPW